MIRLIPGALEIGKRVRKVKAKVEAEVKVKARDKRLGDENQGGRLRLRLRQQAIGNRLKTKGE
jgi:hypothetical protein